MAKGKKGGNSKGGQIEIINPDLTDNSGTGGSSVGTTTTSGPNYNVSGTGATSGVITGGTEYLYGSGGADAITTIGGANFSINTYGGNDVVNATKSLSGEAELGDGNDKFYGGKGTDFVRGGAGNDIINGNAGGDILNGEFGRDTIRGGGGNDIISGLDRDGFYSNGDGFNQLSLLTERDDADALYGGAGNDTIFLSASDAQVYGGTGADTFEFFSKATDASGTVFQGGAVQDFQVGIDHIEVKGATAGGELHVDGSSVTYVDANDRSFHIEVHTVNDQTLTLDDFVF